VARHERARRDIAAQLRGLRSRISRLHRAIVAGDLLGATSGVNADAVFLIAISRESDIIIGILSAGVVLAATDLGDAPRLIGGAVRDPFRPRLPADLPAR